MVKKVVIILSAVIVVVVILALYFTFSYTKSCKDASCFNSALTKCSKASYINEAEDASWFYSIKGKHSGECEIEVELLQLKQGTNVIAGLEGESMLCYTPIGVITSPQANLDKCHGLLKEDMQSLVINKLHNYIVENLGQISGELTKAI